MYLYNKEEEKDNKFIKKVKEIQSKSEKHIPEDRKDDIGLFNLNNRSLSIMLNQIAALTLKNYETDIMIEISRQSFGTYDFYKAGEIIGEGERAASRALDRDPVKEG